MARQQRIDPKTIPARRKKKPGRPGGRKPGPPPVRKATLGDWIAGARPQTLSLAIAPVALGLATAWVLPHEQEGPLWPWLRVALCLIVALALQIGVNYANDYSDGVRGTDRHRQGPARLTASGAAKPRTVLAVALFFFSVAAIAGFGIVWLTQQWWLLAVGFACILAAWFYTGGKRPYGYYGLGEVFVFAFFGLAATVGTMFVLSGTVTVETWLAATAIGLLACAVLMINNVRDREQDRAAGKRTLAVLLGHWPSRIGYVVLLLVPYGILVIFALLYEYAPYVYFTLIVALPAALIALTAKTAGELVLALRLTSLTALLFGLGLAAAIAF